MLHFHYIHLLTFKFGLLGYGPTVKIGQEDQVDRVWDFGPCSGMKWAPYLFGPTPRRGTELNLGTSVRNGIQRVGRIDGIKSRGETTIQETPISMETEAREPIRSTAKTSMGKSMRSETRSGIVLGHLLLGLRNVIKTIIETWPRNEQLASYWDVGHSKGHV